MERSPEETGTGAPGRDTREPQRRTTMEVTEIDGVKVVQEFTVLWHEWECDGYG